GPVGADGLARERPLARVEPLDRLVHLRDGRPLAQQLTLERVELGCRRNGRHELACARERNVEPGACLVEVHERRARRCRAASKATMLPAIATLSDSASPAIGIEKTAST